MCCISGAVQSYVDYQDGKSSNAVEGGDISLNQCQTTKVHAASKIVNHALTQITLTVTLTGTFLIWNWHCCIWNIRFQVNSCQLQIYVEDGDFHTSICILKWKKCNFHFCCLMYLTHLLLFHVSSVLLEMMHRGLAVIILSKLSQNNMARFPIYSTSLT